MQQEFEKLTEDGTEVDPSTQHKVEHALEESNTWITEANLLLNEERLAIEVC